MIPEATLSVYLVEKVDRILKGSKIVKFDDLGLKNSVSYQQSAEFCHGF